MSLTLFNDNITITRKGYMKTIAYPNKPHSLSAGLLTAIAIFSLASSNITYADDYQRNATEAYAKEVPHQITSVWTKGVTPLTPEQFRYNNEDVIHAPYLAHQAGTISPRPSMGRIISCVAQQRQVICCIGGLIKIKQRLKPI